ncbi:MAG TPA: iron ABC transporter permease, partial [Ilumatobacteraceae bacterium]|nr:iron ABC transporter permease [Ilumatobacteraceae bacterium]
MTNALLDAPGQAITPDPARRARARPHVPDTPIVRLLALLVGVSAAIPLGYLAVRVWELGWSETWEIATSERTRTVLIDTIVLAVAVTVASLVISLPLAWLTTRTDLPGRRLWVVLTALPLAIPTYVGSFAMIGALGPRGIVQGWLEPLGVDRLPSIYGFGGAFVVLTLFTYPYLLLTVRAAYRQLDPSLEEASRTLGRNSLVTFLRVVVPQLRPSIAAGSLLVALYVLSDFGAVSMLRYDTFTRAIYVQYRGGLDRGAAAVMGLMLVVLTVAVLATEQRLRGSESLHRLHGSGARVPATVRLGRWRWVAAGACTLVVTVALVIPLSVIGYWLWRGTRVGESWFPVWSLVANSLWASALGALLTVVCAWPVAMLAVRSPGRSSRLIERLSWSGYALPGIVVALALVFFGAKYVPWAYQTMAMLVFAYMVLFLPQAIGAIRASLLQVTPSVEEASHLLGSGSFATFRRVILPLTRPGVTAGAALVFLTCMKELPATL